MESQIHCRVALEPRRYDLKRLVLYLEDEQSKARHFARRLKREFDLEVDPVQSVSQATDKLSTRSYSLIIIDIMMDPSETIKWNNSGFALIAKIDSGDSESAGNGPDTPIIVTTAVGGSYVEVDNTGNLVLVEEALNRLTTRNLQVIRNPWPVEGEGSLVDEAKRMIAG